MLNNSRSFSSLSALAGALVPQILSDILPPRWNQKIRKVRPLLHTAVPLVLRLFGWGWDAVPGWHGTLGFKWVEAAGDDTIVLPGYQLSDQVDAPALRREGRLLDLDLGSNSHNRDLRAAELRRRDAILLPHLKEISAAQKQR